MALYLAGKIKAFDRRGHVAKLCIVFLPLLMASLVAVSRVDDYWHHWQDVFAGGILGLFSTRLLMYYVIYVICQFMFCFISNEPSKSNYLKNKRVIWVDLLPKRVSKVKKLFIKFSARPFYLPPLTGFTAHKLFFYRSHCCYILLSTVFPSPISHRR